MKGIKHILISLTSILLIGAIQLPSFVKLVHALHDHKEQQCADISSLHFHEVELDCDFDKYHLSSHLYAEIIQFKAILPINIRKVIINKYHFISDFQSLHFNLRGPPFV